MDEGGSPPQTPEPVTARRWENLPEASRRVAVHWLAVIAGKAVRAARAALGSARGPQVHLVHEGAQGVRGVEQRPAVSATYNR